MAARILTRYDTITQARVIASGTGLRYVENRCVALEPRRLGLDVPRS